MAIISMAIQHLKTKTLKRKIMKTNKWKSIFAMVLMLAFVAIQFACEKETTRNITTGVSSATIHGKITYNSGKVAPGATVYIKIGTTTPFDPAAGYDLSAVADANGNYSFAKLDLNNYVVTARYMNQVIQQGYTFKTNGYSVTIAGYKNDVTVDMDLK